MTILRVPTAIVPSSQQYQTRVSGQVTVGEAARYLSQYETQIEVSTLEVARPARAEQRVDELDIQGGDRFIIFTHAARPVELTAPARAGDRIAQFSQGDTRLSSRGKKSLVVGKPEAGFIPDIDLRHFIAPKLLEFAAADCLRLYFDESGRSWYAARSGPTRITLDELELDVQPVVLNDSQRVRFYRSGDARPMGEMWITLETVQAGEDIHHLPAGNELVNLRIGLEQDNQTLRVSENIRAGQIATSLAQYHNLSSDTPSVYIARLISPQTTLDSLRVGEGGMLYAALKMRHAQNVLTLRDVHQHERVYTLLAGQEERLVGCRTVAEISQPDLEIDLYDSMTAQGYDPRPFQGMSPYYACITYHAADQNWWIRQDERSQVPLFINNTRASRSAALPLLNGDVVSIGPSLNHYYARLEVENSS